MSEMPAAPSPFDLQPPTPVSTGGFFSTWEDALDIFYAPTEVFQRRRDGRYGMALLVLIALSMVIFYLSSQVNEAIFDVEFRRSIAKQAENGVRMTEEQMAAAKAFAEKFQKLAVLVVPVFSVLAAWITGLLIMFVGNLMGGRFNFAKATAIGVLAGFPELLNRLAVGAQGLALDTATITSKYSFAVSAARFLPDTTKPALLKLAAVADPFVIWSGILLGIGAHIVGDMEKEKAAVLAVIYTVGFALLAR